MYVKYKFHFTQISHYNLLHLNNFLQRKAHRPSYIFNNLDEIVKIYKQKEEEIQRKFQGNKNKYFK